jgi:hypothetical protein
MSDAAIKAALVAAVRAPWLATQQAAERAKWRKRGARRRAAALRALAKEGGDDR